jgi:hypothetical protein
LCAAAKEMIKLEMVPLDDGSESNDEKNKEKMGGT